MLRVSGILLAAYLLAPAAAGAAGDANTADKADHRVNMARLRELANDRFGGAKAARGGVCAVAFMAGPAGSFDITIGLTSHAPQQLITAIVDPFRALGGRALLIQSVFSTVPPAGGTIDVLYPDSSPAGPVVLGFSGFDTGETASFSMDPDTYDNPSFSATVRDMNNTRIEAAFSGSLRCAGSLRFDSALNASFALLTRTSP